MELKDLAREIHEEIPRNRNLKMRDFREYKLLTKPELMLTEDSEWEGWGDEKNTIEFSAFIPGHLFWERMTDYNTQEYAVYVNIYYVSLIIPEEDLETVKSLRDRNNLEIYLLDNEKTLELQEAVDVQMSVEEFHRRFNEES